MPTINLYWEALHRSILQLTIGGLFSCCFNFCLAEISLLRKYQSELVSCSLSNSSIFSSACFNFVSITLFLSFSYCNSRNILATFTPSILFSFSLSLRFSFLSFSISFDPACVRRHGQVDLVILCTETF